MLSQHLANSTADTAGKPNEVYAAVVRDCAQRLRVIYALPRPACPQELADLSLDDVEIHQFSKTVAGASDLFKLTIPDHSIASGVVGAHSVTITYGRIGAREPSDRPVVEKVLTRLYGPITYVASMRELGQLLSK